MISRLLGSASGLIGNVLALSSVQIYRKIVPLITMPYLARTLGPAGIGLISFTQGFGAAIVLIIQFGFDISATREVARCRESKGSRAEVFASVLGAQMILIMMACFVSISAAGFVPTLRIRPDLLAAGLAWAVAEALNPTWYFQGLERMVAASVIEIATKSLAVVGVFVFVHRPGDESIVLGLQALGPMLATAVTVAMAVHDMPLRRPTRASVIGAFRMGWSAFLFRSAESLYTTANSFILGLFAPPELVGYFAGGEKISKAFSGLFSPIRQALYPRVTKLVQTDPERAARAARLGIAVTAGGGAVLGVVVWVCAPLLVRILLGPNFGPAITVLRIFAALPLVVATTYSIGYQWLLPLNKDRLMNRVFLVAGLLNLTLAFALAPRCAHIGMAWSVLATEVFVCGSFLWSVCFSTDFGLFFRRPAPIINATEA